MVDVPALLHGAKGFVGLLQPRVLSSGRDGAEVRLDAGPELHNHLGGPHAAVLFGLGETAAFAVLLEVFGDLVEAGARAAYGDRGTAVFDVEVVFRRERDDVETARATYAMALKQLPAGTVPARG